MRIALRRLPDMSAAASWALALTLVGYPIAGLIGSALNWDSTIASIPFRLGVLALSVVLWSRGPPLQTWLKRSPWLIGFGLLYLMRLLWDLGVAGVPGAGEALAFYIITVLAPAAALGLFSYSTYLIHELVILHLSPLLWPESWRSMPALSLGLVAVSAASLVCARIYFAWFERRKPQRLARSAHATMREDWFNALSTQKGSELLFVQTLRNSLMSATMIAS